MDRDILVLSHLSLLERILSFCFIVWYFSFFVSNKKQIHSDNMSSKIASQQQVQLLLYELCVVTKGKAILCHQEEGSGWVLSSQTLHAHRSFIPAGIILQSKHVT